MDWKTLEEESQRIIDSRLPEYALEDNESMERFRIRLSLLSLHIRVEEVKQLTRLADYVEGLKRAGLPVEIVSGGK